MREITDHIVVGSDDPTRVYALDEPDHKHGGGACHKYVIVVPDPNELVGNVVRALGDVHFQHGPVREVGHNGVQMEHLLAIVADRLRAFQDGPFACNDNQLALTHVEIALASLKVRTADRVKRAVEGRNQA